MPLKNVLSRLRAGPRLATAIVVILVASGSVIAGTTAAAARPAPRSAAVHAGRPAPHIFGFARGLRGPRLKLPHGPSRVAVGWNVDGCDHDYGTANQCVPWTIPAPAAGRCAWLAAHDFKPVKVYGRDRLQLDSNHDGIACDKGDRGT